MSFAPMPPSPGPTECKPLPPEPPYPTIDRLIQKAVETVNKILELVKKVEDKIRRILSWIPDFVQWVVDAAIAAFNAFIDAAQKAIKAFWEAIQIFMGNPLALEAAADSWAAIGRTVTGNAPGNTLLADDYWEGPAASAYADCVADQQQQMEAFGDIGSSMDSGLRSCASACVNLNVAIVAAIVTAQIEIASGILALTVPPTIPVVVPIMIFGLAGAVIAISVALANAYGDYNAAESTFSSVTTKNGGAWPKPAGLEYVE